jgi:hypothetical protein
MAKASRAHVHEEGASKQCFVLQWMAFGAFALTGGICIIQKEFVRMRRSSAVITQLK